MTVVRNRLRVISQVIRGRLIPERCGTQLFDQPEKSRQARVGNSDRVLDVHVHNIVGDHLPGGSYQVRGGLKLEAGERDRPTQFAGSTR